MPKPSLRVVVASATAALVVAAAAAHRAGLLAPTTPAGMEWRCTQLKATITDSTGKVIRVAGFGDSALYDVAADTVVAVRDRLTGGQVPGDTLRHFPNPAMIGGHYPGYTVVDSLRMFYAADTSVALLAPCRTLADTAPAT